MEYEITHICLAIERNIFITHLQIALFEKRANWIQQS